jgi:hypothetical protein
MAKASQNKKPTQERDKQGFCATVLTGRFYSCFDRHGVDRLSHFTAWQGRWPAARWAAPATLS